MYSLWKKVFLDQPTLSSCVIFRVIFIQGKPLKSHQKSLTLKIGIVKSAGPCGPENSKSWAPALVLFSSGFLHDESPDTMSTLWFSKANFTSKL